MKRLELFIMANVLLWGVVVSALVAGSLPEQMSRDWREYQERKERIAGADQMRIDGSVKWRPVHRSLGQKLDGGNGRKAHGVQPAQVSARKGRLQHQSKRKVKETNAKRV